MAAVTCDSELMTNYIAAVPVPTGSHFCTVLDEQRRSLVFCLSNHKVPRLQVLRKSVDGGHSQLIDIGDALGIPKDARIQTFQAEQTWDLTIHFCVAYALDDTSSKLVVVKPFKPKELIEKPHLSVIPNDSKIGTVQHLYMTPIAAQTRAYQYPTIYVLHKNLDQTRSWGEDITQVRIASGLNSWTSNQGVNLPVNTSGIIDVAPANNRFGQGLFILYKSSEGNRLVARFVSPSEDNPNELMAFVTEVSCPKDTQCIASYLNERGNSCLLTAASDGIRYLTPIENTQKDSPGTLIFPQPLFRGIQQLEIAQDQSEITLWFRSNKSELSYARTNSKTPKESAIFSQLLPAGQATSFSACVTKANEATGDEVRQILITNDRFGKLTSLEQSSNMGLWRSAPFYAPSSTETTEISSYTVTLKATEHEVKQPLENAQIQIAASSTVSAILNGANILLTEQPRWFDTDLQGSLDFIIPSDTLGAQTLHIKGVKNNKGEDLPIEPFVFDPAKKPMTALAKKLNAMKDASEFQNQKLRDKSSLLPDDVAKDAETVRNAHACLKNICAAYDQLPSDGSKEKTGIDNKTLVHVSEVDDMEVGIKSIGDTLMDAWNYAKELVNSAIDWTVKMVGKAWHFVCKIAGEIKNFVLDCIEKVCEAASWVWEKLKVGWKKLCDFVGFLFNWDDILETKTTISKLFTAGFGHAANKIDDAVSGVDGFFDKLDKTIDQLGKTIKSNQSIDASKGDGNTKIKESQTSTSSTWATERLKNGGAGSQTQLNSSQPTSNEAQNLWTSVIQPAVQKVEVELEKLGTDITSLFKDTGETTADKIVNISKGVMKTGLRAVREVVKGLLKLVKSLIQKISDLGNTSINIPIFTWLYKKISGGEDLTLFNAIALIIAIPTTIFAKLVTGKKPPSIPNLDAKLLGQVVDDDQALDSQIKADFNVLKSEIAVGLALTSSVIGVVRLLYKMATGDLDGVLEKTDTGPSSFFDLFGIVSDMVGCVVAIPKADGLPGAEYRKWMSMIAYARGAYHIAFFFAKKGGGAAAMEKAVLCLDLLTVLANLGLSIAVCVAENEASKTWKDYDEGENASNMVAAGLNSVAGIGYFAAFMFRSTNAPVSAAGAAVMIGTMAGTAVLEGAVFKMQYDKQKTITSGVPPAF